MEENGSKQLEWVPLVPPPRVYSGAPAGQVVTKVQANDADGQTPTYGLLDIKDFSHFSLSPGTGELRTAKPVDRAPGDFYNIVVVAMVKGKQSQLQFSVAVVRRNSRPPSFELSAYRAETHVGATPGSRIAVLRAEDPDDEGVVYAVEGPGFRADPTTGDVALTEPLETPGIITLSAVARDGGSPPLETRIPLHVAVKTISEPREVRITATNGTAAEVCWERPAVGQVAGYLLQYRDDAGGGSQVNLTTSSSTPCLALSGLSEWRPYELQIHAWNPRETGLGSPVERFTARPQVCADHPCGSGGDCKPTRSGPPGYKCHCHEGYFGLSCEKFDSCALAPCRNFGSCRTSSSGFTCVCPAGFGGPRCEDFNPCQIRSPPCQNGGTCLQSPDSDYTCFCAPGFYGKLCESFNPCFSSPCANNATCQNTTDGEYLCLCQPGYQGEVCEIEVDECQCSPCLNGGDCKDGVNSFHCECPSGYHGRDCSERGKTFFTIT
ncbi:hypothetical protein LAZ67_19002552 [Cordylochernes scorpioides]|uniref:Uncharacterized protein n=1 Tax=Cordylochernes scorpioides TaxID=51811 RepID=A0ABY6LIL2_9ARAC|nr:hypothetical protein LAZ67_19002552 [Cordylochernes scorpioides]